MVALGIVAILLGLGVPTFARTLAAVRVSAASQRLQAHLALARAESLRQGMRVTVCKSADQARCSPEASVGWEQGWIVFADAAATGAPSGPLLARSGRLHSSLRIAGDKGALAFYVSFSDIGVPQQATGALMAGSLTVCAEKLGRGTKLVLSRAGRARREAADCPG